MLALTNIPHFSVAIYGFIIVWRRFGAMCFLTYSLRIVRLFYYFKGGKIMKIAGWICVAIGGIAFLGAALAGHGVFGPVFWMGLGIAFLYFAKHKNR